MTRKQILASIVAGLGAAALFAGNASAHEWLTLSGSTLTKAEKATATGSMELNVIKIGALFGGGQIKWLCDYMLIITVGGNPPTLLSLTANLSGGELDKVRCVASKSTNSICKEATGATIEPDNLNWNASFTLSGSVLDQNITAPEGGKEVGYITECSGVRDLCGVSLELSRFVKNVSTGAEFAFEEAEKATCTIGEGFLSGKFIVEKFLAN